MRGLKEYVRIAMIKAQLEYEQACAEDRATRGIELNGGLVIFASVDDTFRFQLKGAFDTAEREKITRKISCDKSSTQAKKIVRWWAKKYAK